MTAAAYERDYSTETDATGATVSNGLPHSPEAEQALLGIVLYENETLHRIESVQAHHFAEPFHQRLFAAMAECIRKGVLADPVLLMDRFAGDPALQELGGLRYLYDLVDRCPPPARVEHYAAVVSDLATRRALVTAGRDVSALASKPGEGVTALDLVADAERRFQEIARDGDNRDSWTDVGSSVRRACERARAGRGLPGVPTGIATLDEVLGGLRPKTLNLIAGRPGAGKSAVGVEIAINIARQGRGVAFFSLEMPEEQCSVRFGASLAYDRHAPVYSGRSVNPSFQDFERGDLTPEQWDRLERGIEGIDDLPIALDCRSNLRVSQITAASRRLMRTWERAGIEPGAIILDHFLHITPEAGAKGEAVERYSAIVYHVLDMAKGLGVPVVLLCQLNRGVEGREDKRPNLADLKWAGALEETAFSATFLYRPEYYLKPPVDKDPDDRAWDDYQREKLRVGNRLFFLVEKNRGGRSNVTVETFCDIGCNAIRDLEPHPYA